MYQDYLHYVANGRLIKPGAVKVAMRNFMKNMDGVVAPSKLVQDTMLAYGVTAPMRIIPTGVDTHSDVTAEDVAELRKNLGFSADTPVALSLGRLAFEKNIEDTINAFDKIAETNPDARLVIAGDGPARSTLEDHVASLQLQDNIIFVGMVDHDDVPTYYAMADVFVSSSTSESQGLTFLEALVQHTPVVVMNSSYVEEFISDPSIGTALTDVDDLAETLTKYFDKKNELGDITKRDAKIEEISAEHFGREVMNFYVDVIDSYNGDTAATADSLFGSFGNPFKRFRQ
jgi:1,2-diacylglycerol 3-alpha-glucosyltransferase